MKVRAFEERLYREHLQEASFLYEKRCSQMRNPALQWRDLALPEQRIEAHLDGLLLGEARALETCGKAAASGAAGAVHVHVRLLCRLGLMEELANFLSERLPAQETGGQAVLDALIFELPGDWLESLFGLLPGSKQRELIYTVAGYRRKPLPAETSLFSNGLTSPKVIWAAGRIQEKNAIPYLLVALEDEDDAIAYAAAMALLRMGERKSLPYLGKMIGIKGWAAIPAALGDAPEVLPALLELAGSAQATPDCLLALGLAGEPSAVPMLLDRLSGKLAKTAALALNVLTAAGLYEEVFLPEKMKETELFPEEVEAYRRDGKLPARADGTSYGRWLTRLSQGTETWTTWWAANGGEFRPGIRYRHGSPLSPEVLLQSLRHSRSPQLIRQLACEELAIGYRIDFPFEHDLPVQEQESQLTRAAQAVS